MMLGLVKYLDFGSSLIKNDAMNHSLHARTPSGAGIVTVLHEKGGNIGRAKLHCLFVVYHWSVCLHLDPSLRLIGSRS